MAKRSLRRLTTGLTVAALSGCLSAPDGSVAPPARDVAVVEAVSRGAPQTGSPAPAVGAGQGQPAPLPVGAAAWLLEDARTLAAAGDWERAAAQVERALRIERANPWLYLELARIRFAQGDDGLGKSLLARARALAGDDPGIEARARALADAARAGTVAP